MTFKEGRLLEEAESVFEETNRNTEKQTEEYSVIFSIQTRQQKCFKQEELLVKAWFQLLRFSFLEDVSDQDQ